MKNIQEIEKQIHFTSSYSHEINSRQNTFNFNNHLVILSEM